MTPKRSRGNTYSRRADNLRIEIDKIGHELYSINASDARSRYNSLRTYRTELLRGFVLYTHLAIEDLLKAILSDFIQSQNKILRVNDVWKTVRDMRSAETIHWCARLNLIRRKQYQDLLELNRIRNACAHNWVLDIPRVKKIVVAKTKKQIRVPVVHYKSRDLFDAGIFFDEFLPTYGPIYLKLLWRVWKRRGVI